MAKSSTGGRIKAASFLFLSMSAAALACLVIHTVVRDLQAELDLARTPEDSMTVVVAKRTLWPGETITEEHLGQREFPRDFIPDEVLRAREEAINRVPVERILANEFIRHERLARREAGQGMTAIIPSGMRAVSLDISGGSAVSGFLIPGNYVDVLVTIGSHDEPIQTLTLLQAVTVLAVDDRLGSIRAEAEAEGKPKHRRSRPSITVAVTPGQAERITHAHVQGEVTLTLRMDMDVTHQTVHGVRNTSLIGAEGEGGNRMSIPKYRELKQEQRDGTLIMVRGQDKSARPAPRF